LLNCVIRYRFISAQDNRYQLNKSITIRSPNPTMLAVVMLFFG